MLDLLLKYHKRKLDNMIDRNLEYNRILKQSRVVDKYINKKMKGLL